MGFSRVGERIPPPSSQTLTGIDCLAGLSGEGRTSVLSLKLAINRVSWLNEGGRGGLIRLILGADLIIIRFI